jgi:PAS domain S-box-containing protein
VAIAVIALPLQLCLQQYFGENQDPGSYQLFLAATALSSLWAGSRSGILTLGVSTVLKLYFLLPPLYSFRVESPAVLVRLILFCAVGIVICLVSGALYKSEETWSSALSSIGDAVIATDRKQLVTFMNSAAESLTGWKLHEAKGRDIHEILHIRDETRPGTVDLPVVSVLREGVVTHLGGDTVLELPDGSSIAVEDSAAPILGPTREPRGAILVFRDVRRQRAVQQALRESETRYRFLANAVPDIIFTATPDGECDYFNQRWYDYTGLTAEQSLGRQWLSAVDPDDLAAAVSRLSDCVLALKPCETECRLRGKDGKYRSFLVRGTPMRDGHGHLIHWFGVCTNIDAFKRTEEQLHQALKMEAIGRLAGGVAHDFNNILTVITGYCEMLRMKAELNAERGTAVEEILKASDRAAGLTRQLLAFSRQRPPKPTVVNVNAVLQDTKQMLTRLIGEDIAIQVNLDPGLLPIKGERGQIEQVIMNLALNARDAMPEGGHLIFETANIYLGHSYAEEHLSVEPGTYVVLAVSDTGQGMDRETQSHIFEPFFTTKKPGKGTGLGLSTVYGIVSQSGGHVWVYSEPGKGTTFKIYLPAIEEANEPAADLPTLHPEDVPRGGTILVAEDEPALRKLVEMVLKNHGYTVLATDSPQQALRLCHEYEAKIDLLLTDVVMPGMSGRRLAEQALAYRPTLKILYMSGYTDDTILHHGGLEPGSVLMEKPFSGEFLLRSLRQALDT